MSNIDTCVCNFHHRLCYSIEYRKLFKYVTQIFCNIIAAFISDKYSCHSLKTFVPIQCQMNKYNNRVLGWYLRDLLTLSYFIHLKKMCLTCYSYTFTVLLIKIIVTPSWNSIKATKSDCTSQIAWRYFVRVCFFIYLKSNLKYSFEIVFWVVYSQNVPSVKIFLLKQRSE